MKGNPKFKLGDIVKFQLEETVYEGTVCVVDKFGTFENPNDVSYDVIIDGKGIFKHITENLIIN